MTTTGRLDGKVAVITGGASGIGLATVQRFLNEGAKVVVADMNEANGNACISDAGTQGHGDAVRFIRVDVSVEADIEAMIALAVSEFGQLDVLFNNAGVGGAFGALTELHIDDWNYTFNVLVGGVFLGLKHGARQMISQGWGGSIINTGSVAGVLGGAGPLCYSAAKAAVNHLTRAAALELGPHRIRVNNVLPGTTSTPLMHGGNPEEAARKMTPFIPMGELVQPDDIAAAVLFYASDDSKRVTGDSTMIDGGLVAAAPGIIMQGALDGAPAGFTGANRGTTGQGTALRTRPPKNT